MRIVNIFANRLFAFQYKGEDDNEYDRLLDLWNDVEYIYDFLKANEKDIPTQLTLENLADKIVADAEDLDDALIAITENKNKTLSSFFKPLHNQEYKLKLLSLQKGRHYCLRIYAIKIDEDTFIITGGAIKLPLQHLMEDREHTRIELQKLENAKSYLKDNGIFDEDSFFEFLIEN